MKRYYSIDFSIMKLYELNPTKWMILENIHFISAISDDGYCNSTRIELANHHQLSVAGLKRIIGELVDCGMVKRNKKNHLKTTPLWHKIQGSKNATIDDFRGSKNATVNGSNLDDRGSKNATLQPIRENLDRDRENKNKQKENYPTIIQTWIDYRKEIKKPITETSIKALVKKHDKNPQLFTDSVNHSIENGYQGLFEPKSVNTNRKSSKQSQILDELFPEEVEAFEAEVIG